MSNPGGRILLSDAPLPQNGQTCFSGTVFRWYLCKAGFLCCHSTRFGKPGRKAGCIFSDCEKTLRPVDSRQPDFVEKVLRRRGFGCSRTLCFQRWNGIDNRIVGGSILKRDTLRMIGKVGILYLGAGMYSSFSYLTDRLVLLIAVCLEVIETDGFLPFQGIAFIGNKNISAKKEALSFRIQKALSGEAKLFSRFLFLKTGCGIPFYFPAHRSDKSLFWRTARFVAGLGMAAGRSPPRYRRGLRKYLPS